MNKKTWQRASCLLAIALCTDVASAQHVTPRDPVLIVPTAPWMWHDPSYAIGARIQAQADLLRAHGEIAEDLALARKLHAEAESKELENWVDFVRGYWERKRIREVGRLELDHLRQVRNEQYLNDQKHRERRAWDRIKNHPQLTNVAAGDALNFLLQRLSGTAFAYDFVRPTEDFAAEILEELKLSENQLRGLSLRQIGRGGSHIVFQADGSPRLDLEYWPFLIRDENLEKPRLAFEAARDQVLRTADAGGVIPVDQLRHLETTLMQLTRDFYQLHCREDWRHVSYSKRCQYRGAEAFLHRLDREVVRLQNVGDVQSLRVQRGYDAKRDGDHLVGLLTYMVRGGLEFAPARPGNEPVYHAVFAMMRDLYVTVADQDTAIKPRDLRGLAR